MTRRILSSRHGPGHAKLRFRIKYKANETQEMRHHPARFSVRHWFSLEKMEKMMGIGEEVSRFS